MGPLLLQSFPVLAMMLPWVARWFWIDYGSGSILGGAPATVTCLVSLWQKYLGFSTKPWAPQTG